METPLNEEPQQERSGRRDGTGVGPLSAIVIVVILLLLGGLYFLIEQEVKVHNQQLPNQEQVNS